jgi:hypothetical protein
MTFDSLAGEHSFHELDENLYSVEATQHATGKRTAESMVSDIRSIVTGEPGSDNQAIIALCESRGNLSEVGVAVYNTDRNVCLIQQVIFEVHCAFAVTSLSILVL